MARAAPPPLALAYHGVADVEPARDPARLFEDEERLRRDIRLLRGWGYSLVSFSAFLDRLAAGDGRGHATLTFDDGLVDNLEALAPLLRDERATATVFVVSGWLGQAHPDAPWTRIMNADELRALHAEGIEVGGHTASHANLDGLGYEGALAELRDGRLALEEVIGAPVTVAAYPYGHADDDARRACRDAGFRGACRTAEGHPTDPFDLRRQDMGNRSTALGLRLKRDGRYEPLMALPPVRVARRLLYRRGR